MQDLCTSGDLEIQKELIPQLCKAVINAFRSALPDKDTFTKHGRTHFYPEDKELVIALLVEEHLQLQLKTSTDQDTAPETGETACNDDL